LSRLCNKRGSFGCRALVLRISRRLITFIVSAKVAEMTHVSFAARILSSFTERVNILRNVFPRKLRRTTPPEQRTHPFDITNRVDTSGLFYAQDLSSGHAHDQHSSGYYATAPSLFHGAIARWSATLLPAGSKPNDYTLLDIGCGKGRVVLLASDYAFRAIVGVELNPHLARVAKRNLKAWMRKPRACRDVTIVNDDVLSVVLPDGPVVLYLFNSFERELVQMLLDKLVEVSATRSDPIDLIYIHPDYNDLVLQAPHMKLLADGEIQFTPEDAAADVFGVLFDRCCICRLPGRLGLGSEA
jgi:SAM-dependent methyltransferase